MKFKKLWQGKKIALKFLYCKLFNARMPVRVSLQVTKYCNLKCPYCYATNNDPNKKEPTTENILKLIDELYSRGTVWIALFGGEPLLRKDIREIIDYCNKKGITTELATNGWYIKNHLDTLAKVDYLSISIDGNKETCDITRGKGTYERIMDGIKLLKESNIPFRLHAVLTKYSANSFDHMVGLSKEYNVAVNFSEPGVPEGKRHLLLPEEEVIEFYKKVKEYKKNKKDCRISSPENALQYIESWPKKGREKVLESDSRQIKRKVPQCYMKHRHCHIDFDGSLYACGTLWNEGLNIYKDGFDKCWEYIKNLPCYSCWNMGAIEQSLVMGMSMKGIINAVKNYI